MDSEYLTVGAYGKEVFSDSVTKTFTKFIRKNKLPYCTIYGLRHTMATLLIHDPSIPERTIADRFGHSNTGTLRKIYSHQLKDTNKLAAEKIEEILKIYLRYSAFYGLYLKLYITKYNAYPPINFINS